ncbi:MAG: ATP phosphoribosyltransferase regulatory subunit [Acidiferrobacterales bacterium]
MSSPERWLLPEGIEEVLPPEARQLESIRRRVLDLFVSWGYEPVMPPLIEYLEALLTGVGKELDLQTFKLTDQLSGHTMGLRADITPQAARIDAHYLKRKGPARLCYIGPALRTRPDDFGGTREPLQLGAELFGHSGPASDAEALRLMLEMISVVGIDKVHVDLGNVGLFRGLTTSAGLDRKQEWELFEAMQRKAESEIRTMLEVWQVKDSSKTMLLALTTLNGSSEILVEARKIFASAPKPVLEALDNLDEVVRLIKRDLPAQELFIDLAELSGYGYHTGIVFSVFVPGHGKAIANGGRYDGIGEAFGRNRSATGFGADLRHLNRLAANSDDVLTGILAPNEDDAALRKTMVQLRAAGDRVVQLLPDQEVIEEELGCDRKLVKSGSKWKVEKL